jgi:hypothetical protein
MAGPKHILIVDDNDDVRDVIVDMLRYRGYRVNTSMVPTTDIGFALPGRRSASRGKPSGCKVRAC